MSVHFTCTASVFLRIVTRLLFRRWYIRCVILLSQCIWCPTFSCAATTRWPSQVIALDWFQVTVLLLFFFLLLLINSWCAVSNYHSRKLNFMLLSAQLSFIYVLVNGGLTGCGLYSCFKKEKKKKKVFPQSFLRVFIQLPRSTLISLKRVSGCQQLVGVDKWTPWFSLAV